MLGLKKQFIKNYINLRIAENVNGKLVLKSPNLYKIEDKYKDFETYIKTFIQMIGGINDIQVDYPGNQISIYYNQQVLTDKMLIEWINIVYNVILDNLQGIQKYWDKDVDYVQKELTKILQNKLENLNRQR